MSTAARSKPAPSRISEATRERILAAARDCMERSGIGRVTIVDIAAAAKCSRPIIYKHFQDVGEIVDTLALEDMAVVQEHLATRLRRDLSYAERLVEAIAQAVVIAHDRPLLSGLFDDRESWLRSQRAGEKVRDWVRERWAAFIRRGIADGLLAPDLELDEIVGWISMNQSQLLLRYQTEPIDEARVRRVVERFVVRPLLP